MDSWQIAVALVQALAWPLVVLILALVMRKPMDRLLANRGLLRLKAGGIEAEFAQVGATVAESVKQEAVKVGVNSLPSADVKSLPPGNVKSLSSGDVSPLPAREVASQVFTMTDYAPLAAITSGWTTLEAALRSAVVRSGIRLNPPIQTPSDMADRLVRGGVLESSVLSSVQGLLVLRDLALQRRDEPGDATRRAREYVGMVNSVCWVIEQQLVEYLRKRGPLPQP